MWNVNFLGYTPVVDLRLTTQDADAKTNQRPGPWIDAPIVPGLFHGIVPCHAVVVSSFRNCFTVARASYLYKLAR